MSGWVRLWHDMPTDPKWRVIARKSGQRVGDVIAVFSFLMVSASANADERGRTQGVVCEDIGAALDLSEDDITAIIKAMTGKVMDTEGYLTGWEKRQPKREDSSAERAKRWRDERKRTQANAPERAEIDSDAEVDKRVTSVTHVQSPDLFSEFWALYPLKKARKPAHVAYLKALKETRHGTLINGLTAQIGWGVWSDGFGPHAATWLNAERWNDERGITRNGAGEAGKPSAGGHRPKPASMVDLALANRAGRASQPDLPDDGWLPTDSDGVFIRGPDGRQPF